MHKDEGLLLDMLIAARLIRDFTQGHTAETFAENTLLESAVRYQEQVIGEAAGDVSPEFRRRHREIPWDKLIGMRHRLVHGYRDIEVNRVWRLVQNDLERIIRALEKLVPPDNEASD